MNHRRIMLRLLLAAALVVAGMPAYATPAVMDFEAAVDPGCPHQVDGDAADVAASAEAPACPGDGQGCAGDCRCACTWAGFSLLPMRSLTTAAIPVSTHVPGTADATPPAAPGENPLKPPRS